MNDNKIKASPQTPVGVYTVPFVASLLVQTTSSKLPMFNDTVTRLGDRVSSRQKISNEWLYNAVASLTTSEIQPLSANETFMAFWNKYGTPIVIVDCGAVGAISSLFIDYL